MNTIGKKIEPDSAAQSQPTPAPDAQPEVILGAIGKDVGADSSGITSTAKDLSKARKPIDQTIEAEKLELPKGAVVALRKSGGLHFTSQTVIVHRDGRITHSTHAGKATRKAARSAPSKMSNAQLSKLKTAVSKAGLATIQRKIASQPPDGYAYEIVARSGRKLVSTEVFDGSIPTALQPLLRDLVALMPR
jgi:hypothetical protein